jgi:hypothetical protein
VTLKELIQDWMAGTFGSRLPFRRSRQKEGLTVVSAKPGNKERRHSIKV